MNSCRIRPYTSLAGCVYRSVMEAADNIYCDEQTDKVRLAAQSWKSAAWKGSTRHVNLVENGIIGILQAKRGRKIVAMDSNDQACVSCMPSLQV